MGYEGYYQRLCKRGHLAELDVYMYYSHDGLGADKCEVCSEPIIWTNLVDTTNDDEQNYVSLKLDKKPTLHECSCGNKHYKPNEATTYKIPSSIK